MRAATLLGGPNADQIGTAALGPDGSLYFLHRSRGRHTGEMPTSPTALMADCPEPCGNGYAARLSPALDRLLYGTYLPGNIEAAAALHSDGSVYYAGSAEAGFPTTPTAYRREPAGDSDGFVARLDPHGEQFLFATYVGSSDSASVRRIAVAPDGSVWAASGRLVRIDSQGERLLTDVSIDAVDVAVGPDGNPRVIASGDFVVSPDAFLAHPCTSTKLAYITLSPTGAPLFASYLPMGSRSDFAGTGESGLPLLAVDVRRFAVVEDQDPGILAGCVVDAASFSDRVLAPGHIITLFGSGLGPESGVAFELENGVVPTSVAGVRVLFDGTPAPILFASYWQINAIAPYTPHGGGRPEIVVEYDGAAAEPLYPPVERAVIGFFRRNESSSHPAAAINEDGTVNSVANPSAPGSVIALFGTGGGATVPPSFAGEVTPLELRVLEQTATVRVYMQSGQGQELPVEFADAAPGLVAGVTQINVRLPEEIPEIPGFARGLLPLQVRTPTNSYTARWVTVAVDVD